jgi:uncharacterized membrane protein
MYNFIVLIHLACAIVWMGGMAFMLLALRPAAMATLEAQPRARLMVAVMQRFFAIVCGAVVGLLLTGGHLYTSTFRASKAVMGAGVVPLGWDLMAGIGMLMFLIFGHIYFAGFKKFRRAVAASEWPVAAKAAAQIQALVMGNFVLGWLAIAAMKLL